MNSGFYVSVRTTLWHFAISTLFMLSCGTTTYYNKLENNSKPENNSRLENIKILNNLIGIDSIICKFIDPSFDTIILRKENYTYISTDTKNSIDECAKMKGLNVIADSFNVHFANPIQQNKRDPFYNVEFIKIGNPEDDAKFIKIILKRGRLKGNETELQYSLKSINGKFYIDRFIEGFTYE
jgi:hypothetical protein